MINSKSDSFESMRYKSAVRPSIIVGLAELSVISGYPPIDFGLPDFTGIIG